jgi:hypothetical protein
MYGIRVLSSVWVNNVVAHTAQQRVTSSDLVTVIAQAITVGEKLVRSGISLRSCPVSRVTISYEFGPGVPQADLKQAWSEAIQILNSIVTIEPDAPGTLRLDAIPVQLQGSLGLKQDVPGAAVADLAAEEGKAGDPNGK